MKKLERNLFRLTWPIFIELLFFMLMGSVDTLMLSRFSDNAVAAVGNANTVLNLFGVLLNIVATGIAVVVSQYLGAGKEEDAKRIVKSGVFTNLAVGIFIFAVLQLFGKMMFSAIKTDASILSWSLDYLKVIAWALLFVAASTAMSAAFRSFGKPKIVMITVIIANILNVFLNYIFIFGNLGAPRMGVYGAALGTLISRIFIFVVSAFMLFRLLQINVFRFEFNFDGVKKILKIGIPSALENFTYNTSQVFILSFVNIMGTESVTARSYVFLLLTYVFIFSLSFASANSILVGYYIGEKRPENAYKQTLKTFRITLVFILMMTLVMNVTADPILRLLTQNETIISMAKNALKIGILLETGRTMNLIFIQALRGTGDTLFPLKMGIISMLGVAVVFSYLFGIVLGLGLIGIFIAYTMDESLRGITMVFRWKSRKWESKSLIQETV